MKKIRILILVLFAFFAIFSLITFEKYSTDTFKEKGEITSLLFNLKILDNELNYEVLKTSFFLYQNYDNIVNIEKRIEKNLKALEDKKECFKSRALKEEIEDLVKSFEKKFKYVEDFKLYNSSIKNSSLYLATLLNRLNTLNLNHTGYEKLVIKAISTIFLSKNSFDADFVEELKPVYKRLKLYRFKDKKLQKFHKILTVHINIFIKNFKRYKESLNAVLNSDTKEKIYSIEQRLNLIFNKELQKIGYLFKLIIAVYFIGLLSIIYFIVKLDRENKNLMQLQEKLKIQAITDDLTDLKNRKAYKKDVRGVKKPFFALVNIDGFKEYNNFYGIAMGDHILRQSAKILKKGVPAHYSAQFYRIGADEFGILIDEDIPINSYAFSQHIIEIFSKTPIKFKNIETPISVSIATSRKRPLLETADLAMKYIKRDKRNHYITYSDKLGLMQEIKENIKRSKILKNAILNDRVTIYYQPIVDNKTAKIVKYEALARVRHINGKIESIHPYLKIAKEIGLYEEITKKVLELSIAKTERVKKEIAINISMKDIENPDFLINLGKLIKKYPEAVKHLSFEILESETLKDYEAVKNFVSIIKAQGGKIGIDDFGSGYSNFAHIFHLDIDFIKIDGSLIENIDKDHISKVIVENIVKIAKDANITTIAEFVHSKEILEVVKEIGIDCSQGYYLGEPEPFI